MYKTPPPTNIPKRWRLLAAGWTATVAVLPVIVLNFWVGFPQDPWFCCVLWFAPVVCAALVGYWAGGQLVNPHQPLAAPQAIRRGIMIALLAYALMLVAVSVLYIVMAVIGIIGELLTAENFDLTSLPSRLFTAILVIPGAVLLGGMIMGIVYVGWLIIPLGGAAGWLLSRHYQPRRLLIFGEPKEAEDKTSIQQDKSD